MNEALVSQVEELGLSNKEARVYLANLMMGPSTVQRIAEFASIKRVTTYVILESLVSLGLASQISKGKKTFFSAEDPVKLRRLLDKKEQALTEQKDNFKTILPQLNGIKNLPTDSPSVRFYDSAEGIRGIVGTFLSTHRKEGIDELCGVTNVDQLHEFFPEIAANAANPDRISAGIKSRVIYTSTKGPVFKETDHLRNRTSRFVPPEEFHLTGDFNIWGDHVIILSLVGQKPIGVTIESRELAKSLKSLFELAWEAAKKYNK